MCVCWGLLCKGSQHKFSFRNARVRHFEPLVVYYLIIEEQDIKINVARSFIDDLLPTERVLDTLKNVQKRKWPKRGFYLELVSRSHTIANKRREPSFSIKKNHLGHTSQTPFMKLPWSTTYIGSVSQRELVLLILSPRADMSLQAFSIQPIRLPRLLPSAI